MTIINFIILITTGQILLYYLLDNLKYGHWKSAVLIGLLLGHFFIFPQFFFPEPNPNGVNCGMPILGIMLSFWVIGLLFSLIAHIFYKYIKS